MSPIPYGSIVPILVGCLVFRYAVSPTNPYRAKKIVVGLTTGAFLLGMLLPAVSIVTWIVLLGIGVYLLLHRELKTPS